MKITEFNTGDKIIVSTRKRGIKTTKPGTIVQATNKFITVDYGFYNETISELSIKQGEIHIKILEKAEEKIMEKKVMPDFTEKEIAADTKTILPEETKAPKQNRKPLHVDKNIMLTLCRQFGTGKAGIVAVATRFDITEKQASNQIANKGIKAKLERERLIGGYLPTGGIEPPEKSQEVTPVVEKVNTAAEMFEDKQEPDLKEAAEIIKASVDESIKPLPVYEEDMVNEIKVDVINHPEHYTFGEIEVTDYVQDKLSPEGFEGFCIGVSLQYLSRYKHKGGVLDLRKAQWYLDRIIKTMSA